MNSSDDVWKAKNALREYAGARRRLAHRMTGPGAGVRAADHFLANIPVAPGAVISGYWPIRDEFDDMAILRRMSLAGYLCALPYVDKKRHVLVFREWQPGDELTPSDLGIPEPSADKPADAPDILLADEPTGNLDPETAKIVFDALSRIVRGTGTAALIVTHNQLLAEQMDDILTISQGRIVRSGS